MCRTAASILSGLRLLQLRPEHKDLSKCFHLPARAHPAFSLLLAVPGIVRSSLLTLGEVGSTLTAIDIHVAFAGKDLNCSAGVRYFKFCPSVRSRSYRDCFRERNHAFRGCHADASMLE